MLLDPYPFDELDVLDELEDEDDTSPLEHAIMTESYRRYRDALTQLKSRDRELIVARVEVQWSLGEIAQRFASLGIPHDHVSVILHEISQENWGTRGQAASDVDLGFAIEV